MSAPGTEPSPRPGSVAADVAEEFPRCGCSTSSSRRAPGRSPRGVSDLLGHVRRFRGAQAVAMRQEPIPWAYRVFFRHIGLDPDADRTPIEAAAVDRLIQGGCQLAQPARRRAADRAGRDRSSALGARRRQVQGALAIRLDADGRAARPRRAARPWPAGRLVVADERSPLAVLFGDLAPGHVVTSRTTRMSLFTVQVQGVPRSTSRRRCTPAWRFCGGISSSCPVVGCQREGFFQVVGGVALLDSPGLEEAYVALSGTAHRRAPGATGAARRGSTGRCRDATESPPVARSAPRSPSSSASWPPPSWPPTRAHTPTGRCPRRGGPRLLGLGELERLRDDLAERLHGAAPHLGAGGFRGAQPRAARAHALDPGRHKFVRVAAGDVGEHGCGIWHVRPRLGIVGMLMGWWHVKLSSGCPLARGPGHDAARLRVSRRDPR